MEFYLHLIIESAVLLIALGAGILSFRKMGAFHRWLFLQLCVWMVFLTGSYLVTEIQVKTLNNQWVFNLHLLVESLLLMTATLYLPDRSISRRLVYPIMGFFTFIFAIGIYRNGILEYHHITDTVACFLLSFLYVFILYGAFKIAEDWWKSPVIWASGGILLYYCGSIPYLVSFGYLQETRPQLSRVLFGLVNDVLANIRYLMLAISFWLLKMQDHG